MMSASVPATTNQNRATTPYMIPIFLWSTVKTQLRQPVWDFGRAKTPIEGAGPGPRSSSRTCGRSSSIRAIAMLLAVRSVAGRAGSSALARSDRSGAGAGGRGALREDRLWSERAEVRDDRVD